MFKKILIANRGEIACRIMRTLKRMGISSVAVYSEADKEALHVAQADEAYLIGPPAPQESYLNISAILKAAKACGAKAIHPGYGFLSENPEFAQAVASEGIVFIGPSPEALALMGDKLASKKLAKKAGVPIILSTEGPITTVEDAEKAAKAFGYPVLVKAAAGGGGKGMRVVWKPADLRDALKGAKSEAKSSFGDDRVFLEKYLESPRHIEIQVLADTKGNTLSLGERECSLQRRHQKVIEEAPSPFMTADLRKEMGEAAKTLAKAVHYTSAGTVEFVVDDAQNFYFLEMNTRLQVEHPVTEMITGIDIVEEMIKIAAGKPLSNSTSKVIFKGHAIEARIYAEDPSRGFLPSVGRLTTLLPPQLKDGEIRLDTGIQEGDIIAPYYDPLLAKLVVHEVSRELAYEKMAEALNQYYLRGLSTNIPFLSAVVNAPYFKEGKTKTTTLDALYPEGFTPPLPPDPLIGVGSAAVMAILRGLFLPGEMTVFSERTPYLLSISVERDRFEIHYRKETLVIEAKWRPGDVLFAGVFNGHHITLQVDTVGIKDTLSWNGVRLTTLVVDPKLSPLLERMPIKVTKDSLQVVKAPMPGLIVDVLATQGQPLKEGEPLMIIEAMKMENIIRAQCDGFLETLFVAKGDRVNVDQDLAKIG